ncbi:hypothetical protein [Methanosarcina sp. UBA5]|nr:hypothetical protein [Methanosarcina sp. UBA5]
MKTPKGVQVETWTTEGTETEGKMWTPENGKTGRKDNTERA